MFLKKLEALWVAITFAEAGEYDDALTEIMKTEGQELQYPVIQPVS
ncbi:MAG TPA: hypothetical protein VI956_03615 [Nitrospirota bacterium]|nr:hypothetical protein [Nitrospirota bacterium]